MNEENAVMLAKSTAPGCRGSERCRGSGRTWGRGSGRCRGSERTGGRGSEITVGCRSILVPTHLRSLVLPKNDPLVFPSLHDILKQPLRVFLVIYVEHDQSIQLCIFAFTPFGTAWAVVSFQRLFTLGDESRREHPGGKVLLQARLLFVQFTVSRGAFLFGFHQSRHFADFFDLRRKKGIIYRLVEVFPCCRNAVTISFLFEIKHEFKGCAIIV